MYIPIEIALPSTVEGGQSFNCTVTLDGAPPSDQTVQITTNHPEVFANLPSSIVVAAQTTSKTFSVQTNTVSGNVTATIIASCNGGQASGSVTVRPVEDPGG